MTLLLLLGCGSDPSDTTTTETTKQFAIEATPIVGLVPLSGPRLLRRISLDLRGVVPSVEELDAVEADPAQVDVYRDAWLDDPRLEERLVYLFGERWHTRVDTLPLGTPDFNLPDEQEYSFNRSVGEEPLRLMARVAIADRSWKEVVTTDTTMANETLAGILPMDYPEGGSGWQEVHYTDGRPPVGVLASSGLWWRYSTTPFNYNRTRAAAVSRLLLCEDYLLRPVVFSTSPSLLDADGTAEATRSDPACLACHAALDPVAVVFFGFWPYDMYDTLELTRYHPEREPLGEEYLGIDAAWHGKSLSGLAGLGTAVAEDPRFSRCAVQTVAEGLWRREEAADDFNQIEIIREAFVADGMKLRTVVKAVTDTPVYRAGAVDATASEEVAGRELTTRLLSTDQLDSAVEDLSGYRWTNQGFVQMDNDTIGFRVMAGGVDGIAATRPSPDASVSWALVTTRLAEGAAWTVVDGLGDSTLLPGISAETTPEDPAFAEALEALHWRLFAARPEEGWIDAITSLWDTVNAESGPVFAWRAVVSAMFRDPLFLTN